MTLKVDHTGLERQPEPTEAAAQGQADEAVENHGYRQPGERSQHKAMLAAARQRLGDESEYRQFPRVRNEPVA